MADESVPPTAPGGVRRRRPQRRGRVGGVVAVTGIHGWLARGLLRRLEEDDRYARLVLIDVRAPSKPVRRSVFHHVDLTEPLGDAAIAHVLRAEQVETLVHLALRESPLPLTDGAHELETVGTMYLLNAAADCIGRGTPLRALVAVTTAMVYGASARNPAYLSEDHPLRGAVHSGFVADKVDVELQLQDFRQQLALPVCVLRPCWSAVGPTSIAARLLRQAPTFSILGFDPLMQLLHADDLIDALKRAVDRPRDGAFNLAGRGVMPLSALFRIAGRLPVALPAPVANATAEFLWRSYGVGIGVPLDFVRYVWAVDAECAASAFDVAPRYSTREVAETLAHQL
ncbi:MAG: NAD-dependent epimerase/dehydratase family protein [Thermodesulfobacteriota bacterium]